MTCLGLVVALHSENRMIRRGSTEKGSVRYRSCLINGIYIHRSLFFLLSSFFRHPGLFRTRLLPADEAKRVQSRLRITTGSLSQRQDAAGVVVDTPDDPITFHKLLAGEHSPAGTPLQMLCHLQSTHTPAIDYAGQSTHDIGAGASPITSAVSNTDRQLCYLSNYQHHISNSHISCHDATASTVVLDDLPVP